MSCQFLCFSPAFPGPCPPDPRSPPIVEWLAIDRSFGHRADEISDYSAWERVAGRLLNSKLHPSVRALNC